MKSQTEENFKTDMYVTQLEKTKYNILNANTDNDTNNKELNALTIKINYIDIFITK